MAVHSFTRASLFPTLVYEISAHDLIEETIDTFKKNNFHPNSPHISDTVHALNKNKNLVKEFEDKINFVLKEIQYSIPFRMTTSWFTCTPPHYENHHVHNHVNSMWSATYYFYDNCSPLAFTMDKPPIYVPFSTTRSELMMSGTVTVPARRGIMILFPSHIHHYISPNDTDQNRYSLAMNFMPDGVCNFYDSTYNYKHDPL